jgi:cyclopropane fatty-acyl-phospholipid synthase-like methyltransferase
MPIHADANNLPFAHEFFDAVVSTDSYNYFGRDSEYLGEKLLPFVKSGGLICICVPGMKKDCHYDLPKELLASWTPEQLDYIHDAEYWRSIIEQTAGVTIISLEEMESNEEVWADWLACENEYAVSDRKAFDAGGGKYLNFISIIVQKKE